MLRGDAGGHGNGHDVPALYRRLLQGQGPPLDWSRPYGWRSVTGGLKKTERKVKEFIIRENVVFFWK